MLIFLLIERRLVYPAPSPAKGNWHPQGLDHEDVYFHSADGTKLHGWYFEHERPRGVLMYSHGNGTHVAQLGAYAAFLRDEFDLSVLVWDYRGYGRSEGKPHEQGIQSDARAARRWLADRSAVGIADIIQMGRSLGGGVAVDLAADGGARGLVLESTMTSIPDVAAYQYPFFPVRYFMRTRYDSIKKVANYHGPLLQSHGTADRVIPLNNGLRLFDAARGPKKFVTIENGGHNSPQSTEYYAELGRFLDSVALPQPPAEPKVQRPAKETRKTDAALSRIAW